MRTALARLVRQPCYVAGLPGAGRDSRSLNANRHIIRNLGGRLAFFIDVVLFSHWKALSVGLVSRPALLRDRQWSLCG